MSEKIDVHALAAMPGFGQAADFIRAKFDPLWGTGKSGSDIKRKYRVCVSVSGYAYITVEAKDEDEAEEIAIELAEDNGEIDIDYEVDSVREMNLDET